MARLTAPDGSAHLLRGGVAQACAEAGAAQGWMSADESARLAGFSRPLRKAQFTAGRWLVRCLLGRLLAGGAAAWRLDAPAEGPPRLLGPAGDMPLHASLSHSADEVVCAIGAMPVGIDVETQGPARDWPALVAAIGDSAELAHFDRLPASAHAAECLALWTLKEAWIKSRGDSMTPGRMAQLHAQRVTAVAPVNAWLWRGDGVTLALQAPGATGCVWHGGQGELLFAGHWRVSDTAVAGVSGG